MDGFNVKYIYNNTKLKMEYSIAHSTQWLFLSNIDRIRAVRKGSLKSYNNSYHILYQKYMWWILIKINCLFSQNSMVKAFWHFEWTDLINVKAEE